MTISTRASSLSVELSPSAGQPCSISLLGSDSLPIALSIDIPPGPAPLSARRASFVGIEPGSYVAVLHTCDGGQYTLPVVMAPGSVARAVFPSPKAS